MTAGMITLDQISRIESDESGWWGVAAMALFFAVLLAFMVIGG